MDDGRLARLRLITRRYDELRGLRVLLILACALLALLSQSYMKVLRYAGPLDFVLGLLGSVAPWIFAASAAPLINRYYERRFGRVTIPTGLRLARVAQAALLLGAVWFDLSTLGRSGPSAVLIAGAAIALETVVRDWPWRSHHGIAVAACAIGAWLTAVFEPMRIDTAQDAYRLSFSILLVSNMLPAYLDHRLLARTLPLNPDAIGDAEPVEETSNDGRTV